MQPHYVPNSRLTTSYFNQTLLRFQTGTYLYVCGQKMDNRVVLNRVSNVTDGDLVDVTNVRLYKQASTSFEGNHLLNESTIYRVSCT